VAGEEKGQDIATGPLASTPQVVLRLGMWHNSRLERRLVEQLKPLAVVTGAVPRWVRWLPRRAPFLWPEPVRRKALRFMAFGVSRAIVAMQEEKFPIAEKLAKANRIHFLVLPFPTSSICFPIHFFFKIK